MKRNIKNVTDIRALNLRYSFDRAPQGTERYTTYGLSANSAYYNGYPSTYGFVLRIGGDMGQTELYLPYYPSEERPQFRSIQDVQNAEWRPWVPLALVSDLENYVKKSQLASMSVEEFQALKSKQQSSNTNDMNINNLEMGGGYNGLPHWGLRSFGSAERRAA